MIVNGTGERHLRIAICIPCQDTVNAGFALDLARLVATIPDDIAHTIIQNRGTIIPQQRATLVMAAQSFGATHLLWIDSDMRFPKDALAQLLVHDEPIVAANYATRRAPILPTAEHREHGYLFNDPEVDGLVEVSHCGMGLMLVDMAVYAKIKQPWFALGFNPKDNQYIGEDFFFCRKAREHGYVTLIDQALSRAVRHVGEMEYRFEHANQTRDAATAEAET